MENSTKIILKTVAIILGLGFIYLIRNILALLFIAMIIAAAMDPLVNWFHIKKRIPRYIGVLIIYIFFISIFVALFSFLIPVLSGQFKEFLGNIPAYLEKANEFLERSYFFGEPHNLGLDLRKIGENLSNFSSNIFSTTIELFTGLVSFIIVLFMAFYMSVQKDTMENFLKSLTPEKYKPRAIKIAREIKSRIGYWMIGQLALMSVIFILNFIVLYSLGVPYALVIAFVGGLLEIVPYIGSIISTFVAVFVTLLVSPIKAVFVLLLYIVIQQAEGNIIFPQIMKKAVGLNPLAVILAMLVGLRIAGVIGAILALPATIVVGLVVDELRRKKIEA